MDIESIQKKYKELNNDLKKALSHMELTKQVFIIKDEIRDLQKLCPHSNGNYSFTDDDECPYCGKRFT